MENPQFTCISCAIAFLTADDQRDHYKSDHHRYNMKRRVAGLPPVDASSFNQKLLERRAETALTTSSKGRTCDVCRKVYTTENAYKSHLVSKKHREREAAAATNKSRPPIPSTDSATPIATEDASPVVQPAVEVASPSEPSDVPMRIEAKIAASRSKIPPTSCIFCPTASESVDTNVEHMRRAHGFFIPDLEYLVDLPGLLNYLGEKVAVENICLWCNGRGKALHSMDAVRKHMQDKSHCKIAYDTMDDRLDISDYYDFTSSYATPVRPKLKPAAASSSKPRIKARAEEDEGEWEDDDDIEEGDADEVMEDEGSDEEEETLEDLQVSYGDTQYELVLPSGARIGHRSLRRYYAQRYSNPLENVSAYANSETAIVKRLIKDKRSAQIPASGGDFGGAGRGMMTIKVKSLHVAKEAGKHIREHRDSRRKEDFRTKIGFIHNNQKHFRDQLLQ